VATTSAPSRATALRSWSTRSAIPTWAHRCAPGPLRYSMARAEIARSAAHSRVALAGNPSDGYGGAVLACTVADLGAQAVARPAPAVEVTPSSELVRVTIARFAREL